jgi:hypothetical protein
MNPHAEIYLTHRIESDFRKDIDEKPNFDRVAGEERKFSGELGADRVFAGERLNESRQLWVEELEKRPQRDLGHASATGRQVSSLALDGPVVESLRESKRRVGQHRGDELRHESLVEVPRVRVEPHDDVGVDDGKAAPQSVTFAAVPILRSGHQLRGSIDLGPRLRRNAAR